MEEGGKLMKSRGHAARNTQENVTAAQSMFSKEMNGTLPVFFLIPAP